MNVEEGDAIAVRYTGRLDSGEVFDTNEKAEEALSFVVGAQQVIAGFEQAVLGMAIGESKTVRIEAGDAYGDRDERLITKLERARVDIGPLAIGDHVDLEDAEGNTHHADVVGIDDTHITLDLNHHLAGQALTFDLRLEGIDRK